LIYLLRKRIICLAILGCASSAKCQIRDAFQKLATTGGMRMHALFPFVITETRGLHARGRIRISIPSDTHK
jgi:hypothetical protein